MAFTRAKDGLYLTEAEGFGHQGAPRYPSRFLLDIDPSALEFSNRPADSQLDDARCAYEATDRWIADMAGQASIKPGTRVAHKAFGQGVVQGIDEQKRAYIIEFDDLDTPRCISFRVKLEVV